jgi:hypothetical protein
VEVQEEVLAVMLVEMSVEVSGSVNRPTKFPAVNLVDQQLVDF